MPENLMEGLLNEIERVSEMISVYRQPYLKGVGAFAAAFMRNDLEMAKKAIAGGDVIEMLGSYEKLKEYEQ
jgi:hypothetical protein